MKAYRIYRIEIRDGKSMKIYNCNSPGYWLHFCIDPEYAVPYLDKAVAERIAASDEKYVSPTGIKRHVEEYEETRLLVIHKYNGNVTFESFLRYHTDRCCYMPV